MKATIIAALTLLFFFNAYGQKVYFTHDVATEYSELVSELVSTVETVELNESSLNTNLHKLIFLLSGKSRGISNKINFGGYSQSSSRSNITVDEYEVNLKSYGKTWYVLADDPKLQVLKRTSQSIVEMKEELQRAKFVVDSDGENSNIALLKEFKDLVILFNNTFQESYKAL